MVNLLPIQELLKNPAFNRELALLEKARRVSSEYTGHVPGGRSSPYLSKTLKQTLEPAKLQNPFTQETIDTPGLDLNLANNIFTAIYNRNVDPRLQLQIFSNQRKALEEKEKAQAESRLSNFLRSQGHVKEELKNPKERVNDFLKQQFPNEFGKTQKDDAYLTTLPTHLLDLPKPALAFDRDGNNQDDFANVPKSDSLNFILPAQINVGKQAKLADILPNLFSTSTTHVAVRLSGEQSLEIDPQYPDLSPHIEKINSPQGALDLNGNALDGDDYHVLTIAEWNQLSIKLPDTWDKSTFEYLSVVAFEDSDPNNVLDGNDLRSTAQQLHIRPNEDLRIAFPNSQFRDDHYHVTVPKGAEITKLDLHLTGNIPDILSLIQNGDVEVVVTEHGGSEHEPAQLDLAASQNGRLRFVFDNPIRDGYDVVIYRYQSALQVSEVGASSYY